MKSGSYAAWRSRRIGRRRSPATKGTASTPRGCRRSCPGCPRRPRTRFVMPICCPSSSTPWTSWTSMRRPFVVKADRGRPTPRPKATAPPRFHTHSSGPAWPGARGGPTRTGAAICMTDSPGAVRSISTQSPGRGGRVVLRSGIGHGSSVSSAGLRGHGNLTSRRPQGVVHLARHPEPVQEYRKLPGDGHHRLLPSRLAAAPFDQL